MRLSGVLISLAVGVAAILMGKPAAPETTAPLAATLPMGWNSWDAYGETVSEAAIRAKAKRKDLAPAESLIVTLRPHASVLFRVSNR